MNRNLLSAGLAASLFFAASSASAAPVEYVKICSLYGAGFEYVPGTDTCRHQVTGDTRVQTEGGTWRSITPYPDGKYTPSPALECVTGRQVNLGNFSATDFTPNIWGRAQTAAIPVPTRSGEFVSKVTMSGGFYDPRTPNRTGFNGQDGLCVRSNDPMPIPIGGEWNPQPFANGMLPVACVANSRIMGMPMAYTVTAQTAYPQILTYTTDADGSVFGPVTYGTRLLVTTDFGGGYFRNYVGYYDDATETMKPLAGRVSVSVCIEQGVNQQFAAPTQR